ncbi:MAG: hypothetical protein A2452_04750 [Candidatus Firestonebacteria bacterium RIFOXYC2_FULL_39_67]|nr:MAG: hypothetical protein A2536_11285 [Candidatus Firestonebacteria bacterium RIFOXYD2_FULL_39_29]OGF53262.1 MAG: hypothetical protein A2497_02710 [Candidatus Firestonebacteria bacterium RifOxyC12_full_39_7]OGF55788.1 MAG: hypothetical protein A2452_04750 [Candidatus Firestonebacteria bacterium RIFOXYC2_FULL_39_67]
MSALSRLITCLFLIAFIPGCGTFYRTIITMEPVNTGDYTITSNEGICSFLKEGIKVSLVFETRKKLEEVSEYINWNPYVSEQKYFFSVFKLTVENTRQDKIFIDTGKTVLLDSLGGQSNSLSLDYFKSLYPVATMVQAKNTSRGDLFYDKTVIYTEDYYRYNRVEKTLFINGEIYPGVKREGYIVFDQVKQEAGNIIVNLPGITLNSNGSAEGLKLEEIKFKFLHKVEIKTITNN